MTRLLDLLQNLLLLILSYFSGQKKGELDANLETARTENEKLAQALKTALDGDYSADAVANRMRDNRPDDQ